jgi:hypothetical protein
VFLQVKGRSAKTRDIHTEVVQVLASDAISYSTVTKHMRNDIILQNEPEAEDRAEDQGFSITGNPILKALEMMPFVSVRQILKMAIIPPTLAYRRLTKSLHFFLRQLFWAPHRFSHLQEHARVIMSKDLLKLLESRRHHSWKYIMTLDEARFYLLIFLLITSQFGSVQKMKLHKGTQRKSHLRR